MYERTCSTLQSMTVTFETLKVVIDSEVTDYYIGRTEFDSPDVDCEVLISKDKDLLIGSFYNVKITSAMPFDLMGTIV